MDYAVDLLIFGISNKENSNIRELSKKKLSVMLIKRDKEPFNNMLVLPGGYVKDNESSEEAAKRILEKETGLKDIDLYLSSVNDDVNRDPRNRTVSVSYIALVDVEKIDKELKENAKWYDVDYYINNDSISVKVDDLVFSVGRKIIDSKSEYEKYFAINERKLGFDHEVILTKGIMDLRNRIQRTDIIYNLFPEKFTIGALEQVYGDILKEKVVNSAFRRTFADKLEVTTEMVKTGGHRPSYLYKYKNLNEDNKKEEIVDIYNPDTLEKTGETIVKKAAHRMGVWHSAIHLLILNKDETKVLLQRRASCKDLFPDYWDVSVGGHISAGETDNETVERELKEELGLTSNDIKFVKKFKDELKDKVNDNKEVISLYVMHLDNENVKLQLQKEEVSDAKWFTKEEIETLLKEKKVLPHLEVFDYLRNVLK